jgi:hypothetical protein
MPWDAKTAARSATQRWSERNVIAYLLQIVDKDIDNFAICMPE